MVEKNFDKNEDDLLKGGSYTSYPESPLGDTNDSEGNNEPQQKVRPEQVPFKDLESLFVK